jgi:hypothetical protein
MVGPFLIFRKDNHSFLNINPYYNFALFGEKFEEGQEPVLVENKFKNLPGMNGTRRKKWFPKQNKK